MNELFLHEKYITLSEEVQEKIKKTLEEIEKRHRIKEQVLSQIAPILTRNTYENMEKCGNFFIFSSTGHITKTCLCRHRYCPICSYLNSRAKYARVYNTLAELPPHKLIFITLTVKNVRGENLAHTLAHISESFHRYQNRKPMTAVSKGFFRATEITYNSSARTFHPHCHMIVAVPHDYYTQKTAYTTTYEWRTAWESAARLPYTAQVDVRAVQSADIPRACAEITKYMTKFSTVLESKDNAAIQWLIKATKGRRMISAGGCFKRLSDIDKLYTSPGDEATAYIHTKNGYKKYSLQT